MIDKEGYFDSPDCVDLVFDGPGDTTVRPLTGEARARAIAERDKIAYWKKWCQERGLPDDDSEVDLIIDGPGDTTIRPIPPERRAQILAEREKIARLEKQRRESTGNGEPEA